MRRWQPLIELLFLPCSYGWPIGLGTSFGMLEGTASGDMAFFPFCDFGLPRIGSSSVVYPGSLDSLCSSSDISSSSAWALGLIWNGPSFAKSFSPTIAPQNPAARFLGRGGGFWCSRAYIMASWVLFPYRRQGLFACPRHVLGISAYEVHRH